MKLTLVINDGASKYLEYEHTGILNAPYRRAVVIELTEGQTKQIGLKQIGVTCGKPIFETIESISMTLGD